MASNTYVRLQSDGELERVKAIYLVPYFDNPQGISMPLNRQAEIVELAKRWSLHGRIHVISDAAYRALRYRGEDVPSTKTCDPDGDTVIVAGTFLEDLLTGNPRRLGCAAGALDRTGPAIRRATLTLARRTLASM